MSKKFVKFLAGAAAIGAAAAGVYYWFKKRTDSDFEDEFEDEFDTEEFELDEDLKDVSDRGYTPLNTAEETAATEAPQEEEIIEEVAESATEEVPEEPEVTIAE